MSVRTGYAHNAPRHSLRLHIEAQIIAHEDRVL